MTDLLSPLDRAIVEDQRFLLKEWGIHNIWAERVALLLAVLDEVTPKPND